MCSCAGDTITCDCSSGLGCACTATDDGFAPQLYNQMQQQYATCACFAYDDVFVGEAMSIQSGLQVVLNPNRTVLSMLTTPCVPPTQITGPLLASVCSDGEMEMTFFFNGTNPLVMNLNLQQEVVVLYSAGGTPLYELLALTWSASSNPSSAQNAQMFDATWWSSDPNFVVRPIWLSVAFSLPYTIPRFLLDIRTAGVQIPGFGVVPIALQIQGWDGSQWVALTSYISGAYQSRDRVVVNSSLPNLPLYGARLVSQYPMEIRQFVPLVDQACTCGGVVVQYPIPDLSSYTALQDLMLYEGTNNLSLPCVCQNNCNVTVNGNTFQVAYDGVCQDSGYIPLTTGSIETVTSVTYQNFSSFYAQCSGSGYFASVQYANFSSPAGLLVVLYLASAPIPPATYGASVFELVLTQPTCYYDATNQYVSFLAYRFSNISFAGDAFVNTTQIEVVKGQDGVCPLGWDCADCGCSNRFASVSSVSYCGLSPLQQVVYQNLQQNITTPEWRLLNEYIQAGAIIQSNFSGPLHEVLVVSGCSPQVCLPPTPYMCPDGVCASSAATCVVYRNVPGDGCTANEIDSTKYFCACAQGYAGIACELSSCNPPDPYVGAENPYSWCQCYSAPPLKIRPPVTNFLAPLIPYKPADAVRINNAYGNGVGPIYQEVYPNFGGYGAPFMMERTLWTGQTITSNCQPAHQGPLGQYLTLDDDVLSRDPATGAVTAWTSYVDANGKTVQYVSAAISLLFSLVQRGGGVAG
jgi:hypothetical protein